VTDKPVCVLVERLFPPLHPNPSVVTGADEASGHFARRTDKPSWIQWIANLIEAGKDNDGTQPFPP
jgi:hypothetical protein